LASGITINIGYPKLFIRDGAGPQENPAHSTVHNFVAARAAGDFRWPERVMAGYPFQWFSRAGGSGLRTTSRLNDFLSAIAASDGGWALWTARRPGLDPL